MTHHTTAVVPRQRKTSRTLSKRYNNFTPLLPHLDNFSRPIGHTLRRHSRMRPGHLAPGQCAHQAACAVATSALTSASEVTSRAHPCFGHIALLTSSLHGLLFEPPIVAWVYADVPF